MKVIITSTHGQLGRALLAAAPTAIEPVALDKAALDITDADALARCLQTLRPALLINAAAYTAVDRAESDAARAHAVNSTAVGALAGACRQHGIRLLHVSTDFVFDGRAARPYRPEDEANPLSVYGASKLAGEAQIAAASGLDWCIVRTAWLYSATGNNFVRAMLQQFAQRSSVRVVADQIGAPTSVDSLSRCLWHAAVRPDVRGILHFTDAGIASRYDLAVATYEEACALGLASEGVTLLPVGTEEFPTAARRPNYSVLDQRATWAQLSLDAVHWRINLRKVLRVWQR